MNFNSRVVQRYLSVVLSLTVLSGFRAGTLNAAPIMLPEAAAPEPPDIEEPAAPRNFAYELQAGYPLIIETYAQLHFARIVRERGLQAAIEEAIREFTPGRPGEGDPILESVDGASESIMLDNLLLRPILYAALNDVHPQERVPQFWFHDLNNARSNLQDVVAAVGRIEVLNLRDPNRLMPTYGIGWIGGTGFLVAQDVVMTNRHVVEQFAEETGDGKWRFRSDQIGRGSAHVWINFAGTLDGEFIPRYRVTEILYVASQEDSTQCIPSVPEPDLALLSIARPTTDAGPSPVQLQSETPTDSDSLPRKICVCGFPSADARGHRVRDRLEVLGVKRLSLGVLQELDTQHAVRPTLYHDCSTIGGNSGSPLIDLGTGTVWGLHYCGDVGAGNQAEPMWEILQNDTVRMHLGLPEVEPIEPPPATAAVVDRGARPVYFVQQSQGMAALSLEDGEPWPAHWLEPGSPADHSLRHAMAATGLLVSGEQARTSCFLVAPSVVLAFTPSLFDLESVAGSTVVFDATRTQRGERELYRVAEVLFPRSPEEREQSNFSLLELAPTRASFVAQQPLPMARVRPDELDQQRRVAVVGHPFQDPRVPAPVTALVFPPPYGVKRVAFGELVAGNDVDSPYIYHDCSTIGGMGGGPLVDLESGQVIGVHIGGQYLDRNFADPSWEILNIARIQQILEERDRLPND